MEPGPRDGLTFQQKLGAAPDSSFRATPKKSVAALRLQRQEPLDPLPLTRKQSRKMSRPENDHCPKRGSESFAERETSGPHAPSISRSDI